MKFKEPMVLAFFLFFVLAVSASAQGFGSFSTVSKDASGNLSCRNSKTTPASYGLGALYGCIQGRAETVKWFINESPNTDRVANVKLMWNDWHRDAGYGVHADKSNARIALEVLIKLYAPERGSELEEAFWGNQSRIIQTENFVLKYTYLRGPKIDERLIVVTEK